jgi:hypothetical protein
LGIEDEGFYHVCLLRFYNQRFVFVLVYFFIFFSFIKGEMSELDQLNRSQLSRLLNIYSTEGAGSNQDRGQMINRIQRLLARIDYQGPWTFEALNRFSIANQILASAQASAASLTNATPQTSATSNDTGDSPMPGAFPLPGPLPRRALNPEEARPIEKIQEDIPLYNPEIELNKVLKASASSNDQRSDH